MMGALHRADPKSSPAPLNAGATRLRLPGEGGSQSSEEGGLEKEASRLTELLSMTLKEMMQKAEEKGVAASDLKLASSRDDLIRLIMKKYAEEQKLSFKRLAEENNWRVLTCCDSLFTSDQPNKNWFIRQEDPIPLLFLRQMFTRLYAQQQSQQLAQQCKHEADDDRVEDEYEGINQYIPTEAFQRAFERLFFALGESDGFNSKNYDRNNDGLISWTEFTYVFRDRGFHLSLTWPERIYITLDNPDSSYIAQLIQAFMLTVIVVSSLGFILSTSPNFQNSPVGRDKPEPYKIFAVIENICLVIFLLEYVARLCTCWSVRVEVVDKTKLMNLVVGDGVLELSTPLGRLLRFIIAPANVIDFVAIAPGVLGWFITLEGGGFVVLRLVRLTRIFKAFKNPKLLEPVIVIARTMSQSTKALYLLAFNGLLGILISGSLMYLVEKGDWDASTRSFQRYTGRTWDAEEGKWNDIKEESPFYSIPHAFWWAVVTATTVGYGDTFPTTSWGYVVASATMVGSLVIAALPVGVIGGNFSQQWENYAKETKEKAEGIKNDLKFITEAIQRTDPGEMSKLLYIELWNERFHKDEHDLKEGIGADRHLKADHSGALDDSFVASEKAKSEEREKLMAELRRPTHVAEFLGQAHVILDLPPNLPEKANKWDSGPLTLPLRDGAEGPLRKRCMKGTVTIEYSWVPKQLRTDPAPLASAEDFSKQRSKMTVGSVKDIECIQGDLKITLLRADNLINLSYSQGRRRGSNPYARVLCYPNAPSSKFLHVPAVWRSETKWNTCRPEWNASHTLRYNWSHSEEEAPPVHTSSFDQVDGSVFTEQELNRTGPITQIVKHLGSEVVHLQRVLYDLNGSVAQLSPPAPSESAQ